MRLIVTPALLQYIRERYPNTADLVRVMRGRGRDSLYKALRGYSGTLNGPTTAALAAGLGVSEDELLAISMGPAAGRAGPPGVNPCAGKPEYLAELCRKWDRIPSDYQAAVRITALAALGGLEQAEGAHAPGRLKPGKGVA